MMPGAPTYIGGFEVSVSPRYQDGVGSEPMLENLLSQSALWDALHILVACERRVSVELRSVSDAGDGSIHLYILLIGNVAGQDLLSEVSHLMPREYVCEPLTAEQLREVTHPQSRTGHWRVARVRRRAQYVDLPGLLEREVTADAGADERIAPGMQFRLPPVDTLRHLPEDRNDCVTQLDSTRFCLPLLGEIKEFPSDRRPFYEELQASAPVVVSLTFHLFPDGDIEEDRQVATRLRDVLDFLSGALETSGFAQVPSLRRVYERYFLTQEYLALLTIRVAAETDAQTVSAAYQLCSSLGGMRAFALAAPTRNFSDISGVMADLTLEVPAHEQTAEWKTKIERLHRALAAERIVPANDTRYDRFLLRLAHVYTLEEVSLLMRLPFARGGGLPGLTTRMKAPFYSSSWKYDPVLDKAGQFRLPLRGHIRIGRINPSSSMLAKGSDSGLHWHSIPVSDLNKHALIVGSTGSGKTVTTQFLMRELIRMEIPFLVIEPVKTEYYDSLKTIPGMEDKSEGLKRYNFEGSEKGGVGKDYLAFDPMRLQKGVTVARHVSYLKTCFEAAFPMDAWQSLLLENAMLEYYLDTSERGCHLKLFSRGGPKSLRVESAADGRAGKVFPSFATFSSFMLGYFLDKEFGKANAKAGASNDLLESTRQVFRRRFLNLAAGALGQAFRVADVHTVRNPALYEHFSYLLKRPSVVELDAIPDPEQKSLVMAFLMTFLYERRQVDDFLNRERAAQSPGETQGSQARDDRPVRHVLVIEEAHRLLANPEGRSGDLAGMSAQAKAVSLFIDMLAEIRAFRQSLVIVEQIPTKLAPAAVKNTNLKIMLRITSRDDRDYLGEAMSFNEEQKRFVSTLRAEPPDFPKNADSEEPPPGQVQFVAFDENVEQPVLLTLPLRKRRDGRRWLFDEYFEPAIPGGEQ